MNWDKDISAKAQETMKYLGNFGPTVRAEDRLVKGYVGSESAETMYDKTYFSAAALREMAAHFVEVADWLDARAKHEIVKEGEQR